MASTKKPTARTAGAKTSASRSTGKAPTAKKVSEAKKGPTTAKAPVKNAKAPVKKSSAKRSSTSVPTKRTGSSKSPFDKRFVEAQKALLLDERAKYIRSADFLQREADSLVEEREPGDVQFDEESGEGDTLAVERERDLALSHQARAAVDQIDAALRRIDDGVYGICVVSGEAIPKERLEAIPWAAERVEFKVGGLGRR